MPVQLEPQPATVEEAISRIYDNMNEEEREAIRNQSGMGMFHFTIGMGLRNAWNLWGAIPGKPTTLRDDFIANYQLGHADDMSGYLMRAVEAKVNGEPFDGAAEIKRYHDHWAEAGVDPVTQARVK